MTNLSVIILSKNAENLLADCIESVNFADEIIVVDDASTDRTVDLAKRLGARVVEDTSKSFAEKRNRGLKEAKGEWILYIDTDERVSPQLAKNIQFVIANESRFNRENVKQSHAQKIASSPESMSSALVKQANSTFGFRSRNDVVAYKINRQNFYLGNHPWPKIEKLERLFRKSALTGWYGALHESPTVEGKVGDVDGLLLHYTHRDLSSMLAKTIVWSDAEAKLRFDSHHPKMTWWRFPRVMMTAFFDSYIKQQGYKAGAMGLIESIYQAFSMFVTYAKLWELQQR